MLGQRGQGLSLLNLIRLIVRIKSSTIANIKQQNKILILYIFFLFTTGPCIH